MVGLLVLFALAATLLGLSAWTVAHRETMAPEQACPAGRHFSSGGDTRIFWQEAGPATGQTLVMIHGTGAWSEIWRPFMNAAAGAGLHAVAIDLPPFGFSGKPSGARTFSRQNQASRIVGLIDSLGVGPITLVAHSVGARPAVEAVLLAPDRFRALVLVDPALGFAPEVDGPPHYEPNAPSAAERALFAWRPVRDAMMGAYAINPYFTRNLFSTFVTRRESVTGDRVEMLRRPLHVRDTTRAYSDWMHDVFMEPDTSQASDFGNLKKIQLPVLIVWGTADTITPLWQGQALVKMLPHATLQSIDGVGHIPFIEATDDFNRIVLQWLRSKERI